MPMDSSLVPFGQVFTELCPSKESGLLGITSWIVLSFTTTLPMLGAHNFLLTPPIEVFLSTLKSECHEPSNALGLILVIPGSCGWEAFPGPGALIHTRISWALSPMAPQVPGVTLGSPLCLWCCGHSSRRGA